MTDSKELSSALKKSQAQVIVVGAGLAGSECAWQLAKRGIRVALIEQRPQKTTPAHSTAKFAELVCSNSFKSTDAESAPQLLKTELKNLNSLIIEAAEQSKIPAGLSLAVDREAFSQFITDKISHNPLIELINAEVTHYEELMHGGSQGLKPVVLATGPLSGEDLVKSLTPHIGGNLYFFDAIAPIIASESINRDIAFLQNRRDKGTTEENPDGDYLNCPMNEEQYYKFIDALTAAEKVQAHDFEVGLNKMVYFQGCQPIEAMLERGRKTLAFGPMKPVGLSDPRTNERPYAVVQLRSEDKEGRAWNMVGFQTKLKYPEQEKVFKLIPGLENAKFYRLGSLHRNTFINSPILLDENLRLKKIPALYFAGQITGVEGYMESTAMGAYAGISIAFALKSGGSKLPPPPATTAMGALLNYVVNGKVKNFQPTGMNWGLVPLNGIEERDKEKKSKMVTRAHRNFAHWQALI
ncbi:MAG: methylenetetrahydrofolate--tRNA-(uracil(54)-C(5))-methyltransferase (FADH(2)-oxidizing) TrmFO [Bdellovibrionota bacterium]